MEGLIWIWTHIGIVHRVLCALGPVWLYENEPGCEKVVVSKHLLERPSVLVGDVWV